MATSAVFQHSVPANYDQYLGPLLFEPYAEDLVKRWQPSPIKHCLELACGTGRLTQHLLPLLRNDGALYATDLSEEMLEIAKSKIQDNSIHWQVVDAQELHYEDETFDAVVCQFGVMFFPDKQKAFTEALRVLQPGGTFLFLTWDDAAYNAISRETQLVLQNVFPDDPPVFSKRGPYAYFDREAIASDLQEAGFQQIEIEPVLLTGEVSNIEHVLSGILDGSPLTSFLQERGAAKELIRQQLREALSAEVYQNNGGFHFPMQALYCKGVKEQ
jgi:ubiquinone/menaquinone biosynthesis C-methylase UbiE